MRQHRIEIKSTHIYKTSAPLTQSELESTTHSNKDKTVSSHDLLNSQHTLRFEYYTLTKAKQYQVVTCLLNSHDTVQFEIIQKIDSIVIWHTS
jgi:hypothetical protein